MISVEQRSASRTYNDDRETREKSSRVARVTRSLARWNAGSMLHLLLTPRRRPQRTIMLALLAAWFTSGIVVADAPASKENGDEWISLFDGESLDGWSVKCLPKDSDKRGYWRVEQGTITARGVSETKHDYIWLLTDQEFGDFELRMKVQTYSTSAGNSGVQIRSRYDDQTQWLDGPQVDIHPAGPWRCGFIYDETREVKAWLWPDVGCRQMRNPVTRRRDGSGNTPMT